MTTLKQILILFLICFTSTIIFSQTKFKLGAGIESIFSSSYNTNGITPSFIVDISKHQIKIGPRITNYKGIHLYLIQNLYLILPIIITLFLKKK